MKIEFAIFNHALRGVYLRSGIALFCSVFLLSVNVSANPDEPNSTQVSVQSPESAAVMPWGSDKGKELNVGTRRNVRLLSPEEAAVYLPGENEVVADNIFHDNQMWTAKIPLDGVSGITLLTHKPPTVPLTEIGLVKKISTVLSKLSGGRISWTPQARMPVHVEVLFEFDTNRQISLFPKGEVDASKAIPLGEIVSTMDPVYVRGDYPAPLPMLFKALMFKYPASYGITSLDQSKLKWTEIANSQTDMIPIPMERDDARKRLGFALQRSNDAGYTRPFHPILQNCWGAATEVIDYQMPGLYGHFAKLFRWFPLDLEVRLWLRGLMPILKANQTDWLQLKDRPTVSQKYTTPRLRTRARVEFARLERPKVEEPATDSVTGNAPVAPVADPVCASSLGKTAIPGP